MDDQTIDDATPTASTEDDGWQWAAVEIFGHTRHAGRIREIEQFGLKMMRIDVPVDGDPIGKGWQTRFYGGASIFSITLCTQEAALKANKPYVSPYRLQAPKDRLDEDTTADHDNDEPF